jgi:hypothetical protein
MTNRRVNAMAVAAVLMASLAGSAAPSLSAPIFYLSDQPLGVATPGIFQKSIYSSEPLPITGQLGIYAIPDVRLSGVSLDLVEVGGLIKFTGAAVNNPGGRWTFLDGPLTVSDSEIKSMGGGAIPLVSGNGIGPGSPELPDPTSGYLIATVSYEVTGVTWESELFLKVGSNLMADFVGNSPPVIFGPGSPPTPGDVPGATDNQYDGRFGFVFVDGFVVVGDLGPLIGDMSANGPNDPTIVSATLPASDDQPISELTWAFDGPPVGPGLPMLAPTLDPATGLFTWDVNGSKGGLYEFTIKATDVAGLSDSGILSVIVEIPEPASIALAIIVVGLAAVVRRRAISSPRNG